LPSVLSRLKTLEGLGALTGKTVLVRVDLNLPFNGERVTDVSRVRAVKPTVEKLFGDGAKVVLLSHRGRPKGKPNPALSLQAVLPALREVLGKPVAFVPDILSPDTKRQIEKAREPIVLLENLRFYPGEEKNDPDFAKALASLGQAYVNDAFSACHRAHASVAAITKFLPSAAGLALVSEIGALEAALGNPKRPLAAVVGGAKVSTKIAMLDHLISRVDHLLIGGAMANTFFAAERINVGASLYEPDRLATAHAIIEHAKGTRCRLHLPADVAVKRGERAVEVPVKDVEEGDRILDIGPTTIANFSAVLGDCKTLLWNGPMGLFEQAPFDKGTVALARKAAELTASGKLLSIAGGGDTLAALSHAGVKEKFSLVSTAGGAFLEWLEGRELPGVKALMV
jgi:phosphoglycerate kinase